MADQDCYFFVDANLPEEEQIMSVMHVDCQEQKMPGVGWFYRGSVEGYGPFDYRCAVCKELIHAGQKELPKESP